MLETPQPTDVLSMILSSGPVVKSVLAILIFLSVWTWAIAISKYLQFRRILQDSEEFSSLFWEIRNFTRIDDSAKRLTLSPLAKMFASGYREFVELIQSSKGRKAEIDVGLKTVERMLKRTQDEESNKLLAGTTFLATVASAAPFIGLFGTVWGIMTAFQGLGTAKSATIQAVAPGISEALVATAVGLAAAIPAAIAYNYFASVIREQRQSMERFSAEFLSLANRHILGD